MVSKMAVLGSSASLDIFNPELNPIYKDYFEIVASLERSSVISLMADVIKIDNEDLLNVYYDTGFSFYATETLKRDFSKSFLSDLKESTIDYLIIDNLFEARFGVIYLDDTVITNNYWDLPFTEYYNALGNFKIVSMATDSKKYLKLYRKNFNQFYNYISHECNNIKIILNKASETDKYIDYDGQIKIMETEYCNEYNQYIYQLNKIIEDNYDVNTVELNMMNYPKDLKHNRILGTSPYIQSYYGDFTGKLNSIIKDNNIQTYSIQKNNSNNMAKKSNNFNFEKILLPYHIGRIDIKNSGESQNQLEFLYAGDDVDLSFPDWFKHEEGIGAVCESSKGSMDLKVRCIGKGNLNLRLRGVFAKNNGKIMPIYTEFNNLSVNGRSLINESKIVSHDDFHDCYLEVDDGDILFIRAEWAPFKVKY